MDHYDAIPQNQPSAETKNEEKSAKTATAICKSGLKKGKVCGGKVKSGNFCSNHKRIKISELKLEDNSEENKNIKPEVKLESVSETKKVQEKIAEIVVVGFCKREEKYEPEVILNGKITFEKEPTNIHDKNAVKVLVDGKHVAYVNKEQNINFPDNVTQIEVGEIRKASATLKITYSPCEYSPPKSYKF